MPRCGCISPVPVTATNGQILVWSAALNKWVAANPAAGSSVAMTRQLKTSNYTAGLNDIVVCDTTAGTFTVTLPAASGGAGKIIVKWVAGIIPPTLALTGIDHFNLTIGPTTDPFAYLNNAATYESNGVSIWTITSRDQPLASARALGWYVLTDPQWNGGVAARMDGTSDETNALQAIFTAAKKTYGQNAVTIYCGSGVISLSSTVIADGIGFRMIGNGVGSPVDYTYGGTVYPGQGTTIRWTGATGIPMIKVRNYERAYFEGIHFQGNQTTPPSELIFFEWTIGSAIPGHFSGAKNCAFGLLGWMKPVDNGTTRTADYCVRYGGSDADNDMFVYENCIFDDRGTALFALDNTQSVGGLIIRCSLYGNFAAKGIRTSAADLAVIRPQFDACTIDYDVNGTGTVNVYGNYTERSGLIAYCHLDGSGIKFWGGQMQLDSIVGGYYLRHDSLSTGQFLLDNVKINNVMATRPHIYIRGTTSGAGYGSFATRQCQIPASDYNVAAGSSAVAPLVVSIDDAYFCVANLQLTSSAVFTPRLANGEWQGYTPTLVGTGWAVGNGLLIGRWAMIGKTVHWSAQFTLGTTSTFPNNPFTLSLPMPIASTSSNVATITGRGDDQDLGNFLLWGVYASSTTVALFSVGALGAAAQVTGTNPFTAAATDAYIVSGTYEAA